MTTVLTQPEPLGFHALRLCRLECKSTKKCFLTTSPLRSLISTTKPISFHCKVFPTKVRFSCTSRFRYNRWFGVSFIADGLMFVLPSGLHASISTLQSLSCHFGCEPAGRSDLPMLVACKWTDWKRSPSAILTIDFGDRPSSAKAWSSFTFPSLWWTEVVAQSDIDRPSAARSCHKLFSLSILLLTIWSSSRQFLICLRQKNNKFYFTWKSQEPRVCI